MAVATQRHGQCEKGLYIPASTACREKNLARTGADSEALRPRFIGHDHALNLADGKSNKSGVVMSSIFSALFLYAERKGPVTSYVIPPDELPLLPRWLEK